MSDTILYNGYYLWNNLSSQQLFPPGSDPFINGTADFDINLGSQTNAAATRLCVAISDSSPNFLIPLAQSLRVVACKNINGADLGWKTNQLQVLYNAHKMLSGVCHLKGASLYRNIMLYDKPSDICGYIGFAFYRPLDLRKPDATAGVSFVPWHERGWGHTNETLSAMGGYWQTPDSPPPAPVSPVWHNLITPFNNLHWFNTIIGGNGTTRLMARKIWEIFRWGGQISNGKGTGTRLVFKIEYTSITDDANKTAYFNTGGIWNQDTVDNGGGGQGPFSYAYWHMPAHLLFTPTPIQSGMTDNQYFLYSELDNSGSNQSTYYPATPQSDDFKRFYLSPFSPGGSYWWDTWLGGQPGPRYKAAFIRNPAGEVISNTYPNGYLTRPIIIVRRWYEGGDALLQGEDNWVEFAKTWMKPGTYATVTLGVIVGDGINPSDRSLRPNTVFTPLPSLYRKSTGQYGEVVDVPNSGSFVVEHPIASPIGTPTPTWGDEGFDESSAPIDPEVVGMAPPEEGTGVRAETLSVATWLGATTHSGFIIHKPAGMIVTGVRTFSKDEYFNYAEFNEKYTYGTGFEYIPDGFSGEYLSGDSDSSVKVTITVEEGLDPDEQ